DDGTFTYDPNGAFDSLGAGQTATDTFTYTVDDGHGGMSTATATITITGESGLPKAVNDTGSMTEDDKSKLFNVLANDTLDSDPGALNKIAVFEPTIQANSFGIDANDIAIGVSGNQVKVTLLGDDWQKMDTGDTLQVSVQYSLFGNGLGE